MVQIRIGLATAIITIAGFIQLQFETHFSDSHIFVATLQSKSWKILGSQRLLPLFPQAIAAQGGCQSGCLTPPSSSCPGNSKQIPRMSHQWGFPFRHRATPSYHPFRTMGFSRNLIFLRNLRFFKLEKQKHGEIS